MNPTHRLCAMNLANRGINFDLGKNASYPKAQLLDDVHWKKYGLPRESPANFAWMSHAVHHLAPKGPAGIVMPNNTLNSEQGTDLDIRKAYLDADIVECIIEMPGNLFFNTSIPYCLWFINRNKSEITRGKVLFVDATRMGNALSKSQIAFSDLEIERITQTYNSWQKGELVNEPGWAEVADRAEVAINGDSLAPARYVQETDDGRTGSALENVFAEMSRLRAQSGQMKAVISELETFLVTTEDQRINREGIGTLLKDLNTFVLNGVELVPNSHRETLQSISKELFRSWFVDRDPSDNIILGEAIFPTELLRLYQSGIDQRSAETLPRW